MSNFDASVIAAVTGHMNGDHPEDNLLIVRAFGCPEATGSTMTGLDNTAGVWRVEDASGEHEVRVEWPSGAISERPEIRREVVALYKTACEKLGVPAREEHAPAADAAAHGHGGASPHGHGGASPHGNPHAKPEDDGSFSYAIRTATWGDHSDSEGSSVMEDIMRMRATREEYVDLVVQHYFMYEALEEASKALAADPRFAALHPAAIVREQTLVEDLEFLVGENWRDEISPVPATAAYADRIREIAAEGWLPGIIAQEVLRLPLVAILTHMLAALVSSAFNPAWTMRFLGTALLFGAIQEGVAALTRYRAWGAWRFFISAFIIGVIVAVVVFFAAHLSALPLWAQIAYLALSVCGPIAWTAIGLATGASLRRAGVARQGAAR